MIGYTKKIVKSLESKGLRVEGDYRSETVQRKVREAELEKVPYIIVIGQKEKDKGTLAVRPRGSRPKFGVKINDFIKKINTEIKEKTIN